MLQKPDFLKIAFEEYVCAILEGKQHDSEEVRKRSYDRYEKEIRLYSEAVAKVEAAKARATEEARQEAKDRRRQVHSGEVKIVPLANKLKETAGQIREQNKKTFEPLTVHDLAKKYGQKKAA